jgi:hypothetical protein
VAARQKMHPRDQRLRPGHQEEKTGGKAARKTTTFKEANIRRESSYFNHETKQHVGWVSGCQEMKPEGSGEAG